jgi:hypothetical protein
MGAQLLHDCATGFGVRNAKPIFVLGLLTLEYGAPAFYSALGAAESEGDLGVGGRAHQLIFGGRPFAKAQRGLGDSERATLWSDGAKIAVNESGHLGIRAGPQQGEFVLGPWPGAAFHGADVGCVSDNCKEKDRD